MYVEEGKGFTNFTSLRHSHPSIYLFLSSFCVLFKILSGNFFLLFTPSLSFPYFLLYPISPPPLTHCFLFLPHTHFFLQAFLFLISLCSPCSLSVFFPSLFFLVPAHPHSSACFLSPPPPHFYFFFYTTDSFSLSLLLSPSSVPSSSFFPLSPLLSMFPFASVLPVFLFLFTHPSSSLPSISFSHSLRFSFSHSLELLFFSLSASSSFPLFPPSPHLRPRSLTLSPSSLLRPHSLPLSLRPPSLACPHSPRPSPLPPSWSSPRETMRGVKTTQKTAHSGAPPSSRTVLPPPPALPPSLPSSLPPLCPSFFPSTLSLFPLHPSCFLSFLLPSFVCFPSYISPFPSSHFLFLHPLFLFFSFHTVPFSSTSSFLSFLPPSLFCVL